jgi:hypothetical protein
LLLEIAHLAADYCRVSEGVLTRAVRDGLYLPPGWEPTDEWPDAHEITEGRMLDADRKYDEIRARFAATFSDMMEDDDAEEVRISLMRRVLRRVHGWLSRSE